MNMQVKHLFTIPTGINTGCRRTTVSTSRLLLMKTSGGKECGKEAGRFRFITFTGVKTLIRFITGKHSLVRIRAIRSIPCLNFR